MYSKAFFTFSIVLLAVASPIEKRTVVDIENDLATVQSDTTAIDNAVLAFSNTNGTLGEAFVIHNDVTTLDGVLTKTTTDVENTGPVSDADANTILNDIETIEPIIIKTLQDTVAKKQGFSNVGAVPVVESGIQNLQKDIKILENAFTSVVPSTLLPQATPIIASIDAAFTSAVAAFAP